MRANLILIGVAVLVLALGWALGLLSLPLRRRLT